MLVCIDAAGVQTLLVDRPAGEVESRRGRRSALPPNRMLKLGFGQGFGDRDWRWNRPRRIAGRDSNRAACRALMRVAALAAAAVVVIGHTLQLPVAPVTAVALILCFWVRVMAISRGWAAARGLSRPRGQALRCRRKAYQRKYEQIPSGFHAGVCRLDCGQRQNVVRGVRTGIFRPGDDRLLGRTV